MSDNDKMESRRLDRRSAGPFVAPILGVVALLFVAVTASAATHSQSTANTFGPRIADPVAFDTSRAPHVAKAKLTTSGVVAAYAHLPLAFVRGGGPLVGSAGMSAVGPGYGFTFSRHQAMLTLARPDRGLALALRFLSSSASVPIGARQLPGKVSYLRGSDPRRWRTGLTTYGEVVYRNLWPGVDLTFRGRRGSWNTTFSSDRAQPHQQSGSPTGVPEHCQLMRKGISMSAPRSLPCSTVGLSATRSSRGRGRPWPVALPFMAGPRLGSCWAATTGIVRS